MADLPKLGDLISGKYRLVGMLGEGGMGSVYEAQHERIGKRLAVKMLRPELSKNKEMVDRFGREAQAAAAIGHPAIIDIHDIGTTTDGVMFLVMEFLEGQSLGELIKEKGALPISFTAYVACQVLSALDAAHARGIVHRDLKPDNIFLLETGRTFPEIKLLDFGISKITDQNDQDARLTATGTMMGTPYYMSPEQARGARDIDYLTDVYAMGVILYECFCGRRPFEGENLLAVASEVLTGAPTPPSMIRSDLPQALEHVVTTAMAKDPGARYANAAGMLQEILPFVEERARGHLTLGTISPTGSQRTLVTSRTPSEITGPIPQTMMAWQSKAGESPQASPGRVGLTIGLALLAVVLLGSTAVGLMVIFGGGDESSVPTPPHQVVVATPPADPPVETVVDDGGASPVEPSPNVEEVHAQLVTLTLEGVPDGAQVFVDGALIDLFPIQLPISDQERELRIEHEGHQHFQQTLSLAQDTTIAVTLEPQQERPTTPPRREPRPATRPPTPQGGGQPRTPQSRFSTSFQ